jgi:hypothetical protein
VEEIPNTYKISARKPPGRPKRRWKKKLNWIVTEEVVKM